MRKWKVESTRTNLRALGVSMRRVSEQKPFNSFPFTGSAVYCLSIIRRKKDE